MEWWSLVVPGVTALLAIIFGFRSRSNYKKLGEANARIKSMSLQLKEYSDAIDIVLDPDPTLDELERVSEAEIVKRSPGES